MKKFFIRFLGIDEMIKSQNKTNELLKIIAEETKRNADLQCAYNKAFHVK